MIYTSLNTHNYVSKDDIILFADEMPESFFCFCILAKMRFAGTEKPEPPAEQFRLGFMYKKSPMAHTSP